MSVHPSSNANILWFLPTMARPLSRHHHRGRESTSTICARSHRLRITRLFRRAVADRSKAARIPGGRIAVAPWTDGYVIWCGAPRPAIAKRRRAHDRDTRPGVEWTGCWLMSSLRRSVEQGYGFSSIMTSAMRSRANSQCL